jgi:hypothetical protein
MHTIEQIEDPEVARLAVEARTFLSGQAWVTTVRDGRLAYAIPAVLGVFQFDVDAARDGIPSPLWVVAGDLPSAYLPCDELPTWEDALDGYVWEMQRWVDAVRAGESVKDLIPTGVAPTREHADLLARRLDFLRDEILDGYVPRPSDT